jgi:plasmid maintenance system antidote protein VapI
MMSSKTETLGSRIASLRDHRGWIQKQLADKAGISVTFLSEIENDKRKVSAEVLLRIAAALGTSLDYLMKGAISNSSSLPEEPNTIPSELAAVAEEHGWSYKDTVDLLQAHRAVVARRTRTGESVKMKTLSKEDWVSLHQALIANG